MIPRHSREYVTVWLFGTGIPLGLTASPSPPQRQLQPYFKAIPKIVM